MPEIDIKVDELKAALKKMEAAMNDFNSLMNNFKQNSSGALDDMNSDFMGIARKTLSHINDSMLTDISESLKGYCTDVDSVVTNFVDTDEGLSDQLNK